MNMGKSGKDLNCRTDLINILLKALLQMLQLHNHSSFHSWKRKKKLKCCRDTVNFDSKSLKQKCKSSIVVGRFIFTCALSSPVYFRHNITLLYFFFCCNVDEGPAVQMSVLKKKYSQHFLLFCRVQMPKPSVHPRVKMRARSLRGPSRNRIKRETQQSWWGQVEVSTAFSSDRC